MREKSPCDALERVPCAELPSEGIYAFSYGFESCFLEFDILEAIVRSPGTVEKFFSFFYPNILTVDDVARQECECSARNIRKAHSMVDRVDVATIEIHLERRSTDSGDDVIFRKASFEVGISDERTDNGIPDFSSFHIVGDLDLLVVSTRVHFLYDDATIGSDTSDTSIGPRDYRTRRYFRLYRITCDEVEFFSFCHVIRSITTDYARRSLLDAECRCDRIIAVDRLVVTVTRPSYQSSYDHEKCEK